MRAKNQPVSKNFSKSAVINSLKFSLSRPSHSEWTADSLNTFAALLVVGQNMLFCGMIGPAGSPPVEEMIVKHGARNVFNVAYCVKQKGKHTLFVKYGEEHIPGSPFEINVI